MKKLAIFLLACLPLIAWPALAEDHVDAENYVEIGAKGSDVGKDQNQVTEFSESQTKVRGMLKLRTMDTKGDLNYRLDLSLFSNEDMEMKLVFHKADWFTSTTSYNKFRHKLGHDSLSNLSWREASDQAGTIPEHKEVTSVDYSPNEDFYTIYEDFRQVFDIRLNTSMPSDIQVGFRSQARNGYHQMMQLSHCDTCHVQSKSAKLDENTYDVWAKVHAKMNKFDVSYKYTYSKFNNSADQTGFYIDLPRHPANGGAVDEFASRTLYGGEVLPSGFNNDNKKSTHEVHIEGTVGGNDRIVAGASYSDLANAFTDLDMTTTTGSFRWSHKFRPNFVLDAFLSYYTMDNDDIFIDIPAWREGRPGGGQPLSFTRYSAYNRDVSYVQLRARYKVDDQNRFTFSYRYKQTDRDSLVVNLEDGSTDTTSSLFKIRWDGRYGDLRANLMASFESIDHPFENAMGINEDPTAAYSPFPGNSLVYYLQRQVIGEATNMPSKDMNLRGNLSYRFSDKASFNIYASLRNGENNELNTYTMNLTGRTAGTSMFYVLNDKTVLTIGYDYSFNKQEAVFSVPVMDG
ncbi:MAG: hypothetical protein CO090_05035 [Acidobacteria bacterium CG_4_9_14_3_um_filter_49_7]|nr:MAG: hypothetical protein CO090_05035 [Acidobacteria bacterium CG_4_9_14_3_um_filter_49_7]